MNNWLNIQDLAGMMSTQTGKTKGECERFLRTLVEVMREGLVADKEVKLKGLGTFRVVLAEERESVHVNTGDRIVIPAHYKFSFSADKELKERVNEPFSMFEAAEVDEAMDAALLVEEKEEKEEQPTENELSEEEAVGMAQPSPLSDTTEEREEEKQEEEIVASEEPENRNGMEDEIEVETFQQQVASDPVASETFNDIDEKYLYYPSKKKKRWWQHLWQTLALLIIILAGIFLYLYIGSSCLVDDEEMVAQTVEEQQDIHPQKEQPVVVEESTEEPTDEQPVITALQDNTDPLPAEEATAIEQPVEEEGKEATATLPRRLVMKSGIYLTRVAKELYGNSLFWVYIYEHNKEKIANPNQIPIGTELEIPAAEWYEIDATSQQSLDKAANLQRAILSKYP